ncbi:MAG: CRISPR-associated endonuclease Cas2 [Ignavibacteriales bacterium]|nr:CRISPR-associated endonuclease Cas2 [Ignavibacteriales bacterium]
MMVLVSYDVSTKTPSGVTRLRKISEVCLDYGLRVQNSVYECNVDPAQWEMLKAELLKLYNAEEDSLRFYFLGSNWQRRVEHYGTGEIQGVEDTMIV